MNVINPLLYLLTKGVTSMCAITSEPFPLLLFCQNFIQNILNRRLILYTYVFGLLPEEQAGFREGYSTVDNFIFFSLRNGSKTILKKMKTCMWYLLVKENALILLIEKHFIKS